MALQTSNIWLSMLCPSTCILAGNVLMCLLSCSLFSSDAVKDLLNPQVATGNTIVPTLTSHLAHSLGKARVAQAGLLQCTDLISITVRQHSCIAAPSWCEAGSWQSLCQPFSYASPVQMLKISLSWEYFGRQILLSRPLFHLD